ncbi:MAG TPA: RpiB/LacA/LacB family sugar-phosphate isomerase [Mycobacteriales bacterium]|jgi:ribose 5-phosphate isomerase B|nr:RpiB/LacA/LacB family sugar-phosphate isomerase [Mycobacteriales bacterium]
MRIAIAADHNGLAIKARLIERLTAEGHELDDRGTHGDEVVDYPPLCEDVCRQVTEGPADRGLVVGGSGAGEVVACNKIRGIRAGLAADAFTTEISRANNASNVLVLGAKVITPEQADEYVGIWLRTVFRGGVHQRRIDMIAALERGESLL